MIRWSFYDNHTLCHVMVDYILPPNNNLRDMNVLNWLIYISSHFKVCCTCAYITFILHNYFMFTNCVYTCEFIHQ